MCRPIPAQFIREPYISMTSYVATGCKQCKHTN